ncbi:uncharacterized protein LOC132717938 [Ruditapes philippinarum]|uniref:uncharacterized protein LOC132717938 n=1 Tax=Ruditapes philippinarum TaxID=129788 RepID=UPI00295B4612|nr:uncharacterized protein LOC132717938 [Ruditapes philippinarum]
MYSSNASRMQVAVGLFIVIIVLFLLIPNRITKCENKKNYIKETPKVREIPKVNTETTERNKIKVTQTKENKYPHLPYNVQKDPNFDYKKETEKLNKEKVKPDDPRLVNLIRNYYIEPPSDKPYKLAEPNKWDSSYGQAMFVDGTLQNMEGGFFVDSGAHDGEIQSNTLFFERRRGWTGILIEPQPKIYEQLKSKNRKSFTLNACVSVVPYPSTVKFLPTSFYGKMVENKTSEDEWTKKGFKEITVQCFPLYSILLAMNQLTVDYFSLDVEGAEEGILNNIPFEKIKIRTISIEYDKFEGGHVRLRKVMESKGFSFLVKMDSIAALDSIFIK